VEFLSNGLDTEPLGSDRSHGSGSLPIDDIGEDDENYSFRARIISLIFLPLIAVHRYPHCFAVCEYRR